MHIIINNMELDVYFIKIRDIPEEVGLLYVYVYDS
jgi:hypothetical protein